MLRSIVSPASWLRDSCWRDAAARSDDRRPAAFYLLALRLIRGRNELLLLRRTPSCRRALISVVCNPVC